MPPFWCIQENAVSQAKYFQQRYENINQRWNHKTLVRPPEYQYDQKCMGVGDYKEDN